MKKTFPIIRGLGTQNCTHAVFYQRFSVYFTKNNSLDIHKLHESISVTDFREVNWIRKTVFHVTLHNVLLLNNFLSLQKQYLIIQLCYLARTAEMIFSRHGANTRYRELLLWTQKPYSFFKMYLINRNKFSMRSHYILE